MSLKPVDAVTTVPARQAQERNVTGLKGSTLAGLLAFPRGGTLAGLLAFPSRLSISDSISDLAPPLHNRRKVVDSAGENAEPNEQEDKSRAPALEQKNP